MVFATWMGCGTVGPGPGSPTRMRATPTMRILMVTSFPIPGEYDGTAMLPIQILRGLRRKGTEVVHAYLKIRRPWGPVTRGEFEGTPSYTLSPPQWVTGLKEIRREFPFDLIHAEHYGGATRSYAACHIKRWPMVYQVHSLLGDEVERDRLGRGLVFRGYRAVEKLVCKEAAGVVVLGKNVKKVMVEEKGVPEDRVHVIFPGLDLRDYAYRGTPDPIPGIAPEHKVIMYIGSIVHPNQGVPLLIDALPKICSQMPEARCVLIGGPAEAGVEYQKRLGEHGQNLIVLAGKTPDDISRLIQRADVVVHPRLACRENFSVQTKMGVYLASGRPIVATDFGDYSDFLGPTGAGRLTPVSPEGIADGILDVLTHPQLAASLQAAAGPVAEEYFGMDRKANRFLEVYEQALAAGPR